MTRAQTAALAEEIQQSMPAPEWDTIPELRKFKQEITDKNGDRKKATFDQLVVADKMLSAEIKIREGKRKEIKDALTTAMTVAGEDTVMCEGYPVNMIVKAGSRKISAEKLLSKGVSAFVIAECTEIGDEIRYVQIGKAKKD